MCLRIRANVLARRERLWRKGRGRAGGAEVKGEQGKGKAGLEVKGKKVEERGVL